SRDEEVRPIVNHPFRMHNDNGLCRIEQSDTNPEKRDPHSSRHSTCRRFLMRRGSHELHGITSMFERAKMQSNREMLQQAVCWRGRVRAILAHMMTKSMSWLSGAILAVSIVAFSQTSPRATSPSTPGHTPEYTNDSRLKLPADYREWVYLTSGFDMSY